MLFSGGKFAPVQLDKKELAFIRKLKDKSIDSDEVPLRERCECPEWAFERLSKSLGDDFEKEMRAMMDDAPMDIRVNTLKTDRDTVFAKLKKEGMDIKLGEVSPLSIRVFGRPNITQNPLYLNGAIDFQDEGSQMIAVLADAKPGEQVVDFCAGAGGKTLAMGAAMENKGRIIALDVLGRRLQQAKKRFVRAGLHNIETKAIEHENDRWVKRRKGKFDLVLIDAPCSGIGTWRREADKHWRVLGPQIEELLPLQENILRSASRLVKAGGRLVYATCSILDDENESQVSKFLRDHPEFKLKGEFLKLTPAVNDTDGFFAAVLVKDEAKVESETETETETKPLDLD